MEHVLPLVIALNMIDVARNRGLDIDTESLSQILGVPVVATCGNKGIGSQELLECCAAVADGTLPATPRPVTDQIDAIAFVLAVAVYQAGRVLGLGIA